MFTIGLIDDEESQRATIRRTIKINAPPKENFQFKSYSLSEESGKLVEDVFQNVMADIGNGEIACLIIDYKIMVKTIKIKGTEIFRKIKEVVPKFPIIILTDVVEESIEPDYIDADKVYMKREFFKIEDDYSKGKVNNIFDSMRKYVEKRDSLILTLSELKKNMISKNTIEHSISQVLKVETELDDFCPIEQTQFDKIFDEDKAKRIIRLIEDANKLLE